MKLLGYFRSLPTGSPNGCQLYSEVKGDVDDTHIALYTREAGQTNQVRLKNTPFKELFSEDLY